jgi:Zn-dependent peptidase ImmA (M78 family)
MKQAKRFVKEVNYNVNINSVLNAIQQRGYIVLYYDNVNESDNKLTDTLIEHYELEDYKNTVNAFTYINDIDKIVFIKASIPGINQLYAFLHELGHIILGHLENPRVDEENDEMAADAFVYNVLEYASYPHFIKRWLQEYIIF